MAARWEQGVSGGVIEPERIFAISTESAAGNQQYRVAHALSFPIYQDVESAFLNRHGVVTYPMEMAVSASGTIQSLGTDSVTPIDGESVRALVNEQ
jgi:hypothetical protein